MGKTGATSSSLHGLPSIPARMSYSGRGRAVELYRDRFISYSGGNFATYGAINTSGISGIAPIFKIITDKQGRFVSGNIIPITQVGDKIPKIDPEKTVIGRIIYLNRSDFPKGNGLDVSPDGSITRR